MMLLSPVRALMTARQAQLILPALDEFLNLGPHVIQTAYLH